MKGKTKKESNVPNLRFKEFKGEWERKRLAELSEKINSGKTPLGGESVYRSEGVLFIRSQNVNNDRLELENSAFISEEVNSEMRNSIVQPNDILLNITGASLGRSCVVPQDFETGNVNQHVCIIRIKGQHDPRFIQPFLSSNKGQNIFKSLQTGSGREGLNFENIKNIEIFLPSVQEQNKISSFLSLLEERIITQRKIIQNLKTLMKGLSKEIFAQQLRFKDENGNDFPAWEEKKLSEIYAFRATNSFSREDLNYEIGETKNIHYGDIHTKFSALFDIAKEQVPYLNPDISTTRVQEDNYCKEGDVVFADASEDMKDIGKAIEIVNLNNEKLLSGLHTLLARPIQGKLYIGFGGYLFQSQNVRKQIQRESQGTKVLGISASRLTNIELGLPCIAEQNRIFNSLSSIDKKIELEKKVLAQYEEQKKYLLQNMFI
jgi:type I restriction enzyme S subunit